MSQTEWVIQVLDDSHRRSIEYENRFWLRQHVDRLGIIVCVEDCVVNYARLCKYWSEAESILIQEGKIITKGEEANPSKEALILISAKAMSTFGDYYIFLYTPQEH